MNAAMMTLSMTRLGQKPSSSCKMATRMYAVFIEIGLVQLAHNIFLRARD